MTVILIGFVRDNHLEDKETFSFLFCDIKDNIFEGNRNKYMEIIIRKIKKEIQTKKARIRIKKSEIIQEGYGTENQKIKYQK